MKSSKSKLPYKLVESRTIYQGHIVRLVKDRFILNVRPDKTITRELLIHPGAVVILPLADKKNIILLKQFRYAAKGDLWEIPAGTMEKGENPLYCAKRELEEETGFKAKHFKLLTRFLPAPGISDELMTLFLAEGLYAGKKNLDHDEFIEHQTVSVSQALKMVKSGKIRDGKTIAAILWLHAFGR